LVFRSFAASLLKMLRSSLCVAVMALGVNLVVGDTPANCTYPDIVGEWVFQIGEGGHDRKLNCTSFGTGSSKL